ncbi:MAG: Hsp20/alpha crystallin family protein [Crocinitomicaceae bacterium]|nr:Hsp20/alpha crystallin family protein [Crocinitomicaceae bacterium]
MFIDEIFKIVNEERYNDAEVILKEATDKLELNLYVAGVKKSDITISINSNLLTIEAKNRVGYSNWKYKNSWRIDRTLDTEKVSSSYVDGVLTIIFPKMNIQTSKQIPIA